VKQIVENIPETMDELIQKSHQKMSNKPFILSYAHSFSNHKPAPMHTQPDR